MPKITSEIQAANQAVSTRVAKDVLQDLPKEYLGIDSQTPAAKARPIPQAQQVKQPTKTLAVTQPESMASASQP
jgi:hypothetical protein